jgi:gamma-glutamylputrescine oxidase
VESIRQQWGKSIWELMDRDAVEYGVAADANIETPDVAIVGCGLTGASTALHLAKHGVRAVVFEAGLVADGASGRTGGLVLEGTAAGILKQVENCVPGLQRVVEENRIDCDLDLRGCWEIKHRDSPPNRRLPWSDNDLPVSIAKTVTGGVVNPLRLTRGIANAAVREGATIFDRTTVANISIVPQLTIEVANQRIHPGRVVVATNAWIDTIVPEAPPLRSSLTYACATEPLDSSTLSAVGLAEGMPFYTSDVPYLWGRTTPDGRLLIGSGLFFGSPEELDRADVHRGRPGEVLSALEERVRRLHPALKKVQFAAGWAGPIAFTDDMVPLLGTHPSSDRVFVSGGYSGHGVALSVRAGELMALAIAKDHPLPTWGKLSRG